MSKAFTRNDLAADVAEHFALPLAQGRRAVDVMLESVLEALRKGQRVDLRPLGTFRPITREPRRHYNPKAKRINERAPCRKAVKFRLSKRAAL